MTDGVWRRSPVEPLSVTADLTVAVDGAEASVVSTTAGDRLFVRFGSLRGAARAARGLPPRADRGIGLLSEAELTVEVRVRDRTVALAGAAARPGVVSRALGVDPIEVRPAGGLAALGRELAAGVRAVRRALG